MKKEIIRKEFLKLRLKQKSYKNCQKILEEEYGYKITIRTLKRWQNRFDHTEWNLIDYSRKPKVIHQKVTQEATERIIALRKRTGWGAQKLRQELPELNLSHDTINKILQRNTLILNPGKAPKLPKGVRFQRKHINSLWHIDDSEFGKQGKIIAVIDDCSRYCLGIIHLPRVNTKIATQFLEELILKFGKPHQIISDNGAPYGLKSKTSKFDRWCKKRHIEHIRTRVKRPQTNGKVERLFGTIAREIKFCNSDIDYFRYRYNHFRPHQSLKWKTPSEVFNDFTRNFIW